MYDGHVNNNNGNNNNNNNVNYNAVVDNSAQFQYNDKLLEVVIIENGEDDRDGYVELIAVSQLIAPLVNIRGFNPAVMWANVHNSQKLTRNNKSYVHVFALGKYLSSYKLSPSGGQQRPELLTLKQLMCDLLVGAQSQIVDPLVDIKTQLCTLQECIQNNNSSTIYSSPSLPPFENLKGSGNDHDFIKDLIRSEHASLYNSLSNAFDNIKSMQADLTNKIAFSNDAMLDGFKSIKDIINRKK
ncbi:viral capsid protein [Alphabaculovirus altersperidaniae]|uniref:Viral capsid protein n=1 Tax=Spodoptera eridania nucleopolyhedrovirus TaxID=2315721 RepID=A0ABX6TQG5_9ABAC|nr:viral capsid protein [Spodoptera eridania nucleopolyhedrovirus]QNV47854.1 viral capsid protein [Spodoptera eridania nucleopolyhedrovirus]